MSRVGNNPITIPEDKQAMLSAFFSSSKSSDEEIVKQIALTYERGYLADPLTATGIAAASECSDKEAVITMGTAHPAKFKNAMVSTGGIALKSGNIGDYLEVKNTRSGIIIKGILKKDKKINVFF